jgi:ubiquinone/menaquinone biosynthesis C-methylase UbiE
MQFDQLVVQTALPRDMRIASDAEALYTARDRLYSGWMSIVRHEQAVRALLEHTAVVRPNMRMLDAGCGPGAATFGVLESLKKRRSEHATIDAFDLTPAMLERFQARLAKARVDRVRFRRANVLTLDNELPEDWAGYDLVVSTSMLDYVPQSELTRALSALHRRLSPAGSLLAVITKQNIVSRVMIEWAWKANGYSAAELRAAFSRAGLSNLSFGAFPRSYFWMNITNHVVIARSQ